VLGRDTSVGEGATISSSVLGRECRIGRDVTLENCYLWGSVTVPLALPLTTASPEPEPCS
jgi:translation initiation factor eIF-2B subunit epsilon